MHAGSVTEVGVSKGIGGLNWLQASLSFAIVVGGAALPAPGARDVHARPAGQEAGVRVIDVTFRELAKGPVAGHYAEGTPLLADFGNAQFPESTHFDPESGYLFVSNINGLGVARDSNGWIARLDPTRPGSKLEPWVKGLNAPKGMRASRGTLWVVDIDEVVGISIDRGAITHRIKVPGAKFLNDVAVDGKGALYASDTFTNSIHRIVDESVETWVSGPELEGPNGLLVDGDTLMVAALGPTGPDFVTKHPGRLITIDLATRKVRHIHDKPFGNLDGIEKYDEENFLVSDWPAGKVYLMNRSGDARVVIEGILGAADIGYDPVRKWVAIPRMGEDRVSVVDLGGAKAQQGQPVTWPPAWEKGRRLAISCTACHGRVDNEVFPRLDGQHEPYLAKALHDFRSGARANPLMGPQAKDLKDEDIAALATYFASRRPEPAGTVVLAGSDAPDAVRRARLGKSQAAVCAACHGAGGNSSNPAWPKLASQKRGYLAKSLKDFRDGTRKEPTMNGMAAPLTDEAIENLAAYFAAQPAGKK